MRTFSVTIRETVDYYLDVEADGAEAAQEKVEAMMQQPTWEDPRHSEVQGQVVHAVVEVTL